MHSEVIGGYLVRTPRIDPTAFVAANASVMGDVSIGAESSVWYGCTLRGDVNAIRIGCRTNIQDGAILHGATGLAAVVVGDDVTVGHGAVLHACTVEDRGFIGIGAVVLDGAVIGEGAVVAAGAMVTPGKRVPPGELWAGRPAKPLRPLTDADRAEFAANGERYRELARLHRARRQPPAETKPSATKLIQHVGELPAYAPAAHHGTENRRLVDAAFGAGFEMILGRIAPGGEASRHYHATETQVFYILKGEASVSLGDDPPRRCGPGTVIRIPPRLAHEVVAEGDEPLEVIVLYSPPLGAGGFVEVPRRGGAA
jgi:carbonic anhydrase/acetyltransferase-like protein (isoleucine patch superfamily)/quercetin dioxygenase-like cupin family protein